MEDFDIEEIFERSQNANWMLPAFDQQDAIYLSSSRQMLEPIMEETSEDEEGSSLNYNQYENGAWSSESETGSVIRIEFTNDQDSISERGLACPAKRARRGDLDLNLLLQPNQQTMQLLPQSSIIPLPVSTTTITNSFNPSQLSTTTNSSVTSSNNSHNSYMISGLIDSPQNIRKFSSRNNDSSVVGSLLDSPVADLPIFRKRFDDFNIYSDSESLSYNSLSRSSSLIQFESLERQMQNDLSSSSVGSSPSLLSFDAITENSNGTLNHRGSNGSLKRFESSDSRLHQTYFDLDKIDFDKNTAELLFRTSRALSEERQSKSDSESSSDNSILSHEERILVQPLNSQNQTPTHCLDTSARRNSSISGSSRTKSSAENLSEDSGYCEHYQPLRTKSKSIPSFDKFCEEDEFENHKSLENVRFNAIPSRRSSDSSTGSDDERSKHSPAGDIDNKKVKYEKLHTQESPPFNSKNYLNNPSNAIIHKNEHNIVTNISIKDKNSKLISSKATSPVITTSKYTKASSKFSSSSSSSPSSSNSSSDEDYCIQYSNVSLNSPTIIKTTTSKNQKHQNKQSNANSFVNFANITIENNDNNEKNNSTKDQIDADNTFALHSLNYSQLNAHSKYACAEKTQTYSAMRILPESSSIPIKYRSSTESSAKLTLKSTTNSSPLNSYFPTNSSSLPDVRGEYYSYEKQDSILNEHHMNNEYPNENIHKNNTLIKRNSSGENCTSKNNNTENNYQINREFICKKQSNCDTIATRNKIFRINCTSPDPIDDYHSIIVYGQKLSNKSFNPFGVKSLSLDQIDKCNKTETGLENSIQGDKYLTERSSVPKDLNLLKNITSDDSNINYSLNNKKSTISHSTENNDKSAINKSTKSKEFYLHHQNSSSGYDSFTNYSQDSNCDCNNDTYSENDKFDASELSFSWNETTVLKRGINSANEKRAIYANTLNKDNSSNSIITHKNKIKSQRYSGEFNDFPDSTRSHNSGLNYMNASYHDLTLLDYSGKNRNNSPAMDSLNLKRSSKELISNTKCSQNESDNEISKGNFLLDEISENFDKNLSILSDTMEDSDQLNEFMDKSTPFEDKPSPPIRSSKIVKGNKTENSSMESDRVPIKKPPRRNLKSNQQKQPKTFDVDPSIIRTSYAENLERCNFDPKEISTQDLSEAVQNRRSIIHSTPIKRSFVASTPNLHSFKIDKVSEDFDELKISSASNSLQRLPQEKKLGILVASGSKQSLGKSVNFSPVVAEYSWRERSNSSSYDPDSLEEVNDPILIANTVANEKYNCASTNTDVVDGDSSDFLNVVNNRNKKILRETNFEWNGNKEELITPTLATKFILPIGKRDLVDRKEKPQKLFATTKNNKNNTTNITMTTTTTTAPQIILPATSPESQFGVYVSNKTNASEASNCNEGCISNIQSNGNKIVTVNLCNNNKNLVAKSATSEKIKQKYSSSLNNINKSSQPLIIKENSIKMLEMEQNNLNALNVPLQNGITIKDEVNIENNIKNLTKNLIESEQIIINNNNNNNYNNTNNGVRKNNNSETTKIATTPIRKINNSKSNSMPSVKTYSSAGNSPASQTVLNWKNEYSQNPSLATTVPLNQAHNNDLLNSKFKTKSEEKQKSFLSRFAGNFRFSLRRKSKKTLPNEPMPTSVTEQQNNLTKNNRNIFGVNKKKSIADGAIKTKANNQNNNSSKSSTSLETPDFIYIPLKGPIPVNDRINNQQNNQQINNTVSENQSFQKSGNNIIQPKEQNVNGCNTNFENNHMLNQVTGKPPLPKQPPRVLIGEKGFINQQHVQQQNSNKINLSTEEKLLSMHNQYADSNNAQFNGEFKKREIRSQSQPNDGEISTNAGNILDKFLDKERYFYSSDYQFDETMNGNGSYNNNSNNMDIGDGGIKIQNGCNKLVQENTKTLKNNYETDKKSDDYVPPPTQFTDEKPPSGKIRKSSHTGAGVNIINCKNKIGLIETNLDTHETVISGKTRSLMELGPNHSTRNYKNHTNTVLRQQNDQIDDDNNDDDDDDDDESNVNGSSHHHHHGSIRRPHKSMEFLLDKENQKNAAPPENELQKSHDSTAALSEHQLRVQASLQRLNIPDWYRAYSSSSKTGTETTSTGNNNSQTSGYKPGSFTRKRASDSGRWAGLNSKTTSLSSLGSQRSDRSPLLLSPSAHSHHGATVVGCTATGNVPVTGGFSRWSTSYLNSTQTSPSVSQRGSFSRGGPINSSFSSVGGGGSGASSIIRSSFRQPYMGWRSQEKINQPRTPHERLASSILSTKPPKSEQAAVTPEIQSSIKEVTSAIVHHFNDQNRQPITNTQAARSRSTSPNSRKCWVESSFVGVRPLDSPQTPTIETNSFTSPNASTSITNQHSTQQYQQYQQQHSIPNNHQQTPQSYDPVSTFRTHTNTTQRYQQQHQHQYLQQPTDILRINGVVQTPSAAFSSAIDRSPSSASLEDVLASLLGLPPNDTSNTYRSTGDTANELVMIRANHSQNQQKHASQKQPTSNSLQVEQQGRLRRKSEGDAQKQQQLKIVSDVSVTNPTTAENQIHVMNQQQQYNQQLNHPPRRVSLDSSESKGTSDLQIKCRNTKCDNSATPVDAKKYYKSCHNCSHLYCSRECRRAHWEKHRKACLHSRVSNLCRQVLSACKDDLDSLRHLSLLARRGYLTQGRGVVRILFRSPESAEGFIKNGFQCMGEASYVRWPDLMPAEMGLELYSELLRLSTEYKPDTKMLIYVAICVVSEAPGTATAPVKWERQLVSRCAKLKLCKTILSELAIDQNNLQSSSIEQSMDILILKFDCQKKTTQQQKEFILQNIINVLNRKGVILKKHYPEIYQRLQNYTEGQTERFLPVTLHPRDSTTGQGFVCIILPTYNETDIQLPTSDIGNRVTTIDIGEELLES